MRFNMCMKKIICAILIAVIFILASVIAITKIIEHGTKEKAIKNGNSYGYDISFINCNSFCLEKDGIKFFYKINFSRIDFEKCIFLAEEEGVDVKEGQVEIYIENKSADKLSILYHDNRLVIRDDKEEKYYNTGGYICDKNFDEASIEGDAIIDGEQKALDAYWGIMRITTINDLKTYYDQALSICDQLNH